MLRHPLLALILPLLFLLPAAEAATTVQFRIDLRDEIAAGRFDPARDMLGVRGSSAPLNWGRSLPLQAAEGGSYVGSIVFERAPFGGQPLQYKLRIERRGQGVEDRWEQGRNHPLVLLPSDAQTVARAFNAPPAEIPLQRTGTIERLPSLESRHVGPREIQVWLPPGYEKDTERRYPVLYLHDGQNVFDAASAGAEWQVDETAQRLVSSGAIEPVIIVGVASGPERFKDYTPTRDSGQPMGGGAAQYARYLVEELKPLIDARYRTRPEARHTAVGGSSLGGLVSMWLLLHHGDTFGAGLVVSPSIWWDGRFILRDTRAYQGKSHPRVWLDMGAQEGGQRALDLARDLRDALESRGWQPETTLRYAEDPEGGHDEASWASRVEGMLRYLYGQSTQGASR